LKRENTLDINMREESVSRQDGFFHQTWMKTMLLTCVFCTYGD
jgi:hypothetical protein